MIGQLEALIELLRKVDKSEDSRIIRQVYAILYRYLEKRGRM